MCKWKTKMSETATYILVQIRDGQKVFILEDKFDAALALVKVCYQLQVELQFLARRPNRRHQQVIFLKNLFFKK